MSDYHLSSTTGIKDEYVHEVCRYGGAEPHALAALVILFLEVLLLLLLV